MEAASPTLRLVGAISPSSAAALETCRLQLIFSKDREHRPELPMSTAQALGIAAHVLTERVWRGRYTSVPPEVLPSRLADAWREQVEMLHAKMQAASTCGPVPPPERWRDYSIARARLLRKLSKRAQDLPASKSAGGGTYTERWLESPDGAIEGRVDRIEHGPDGTHIIDLKTAPMIDDEMDPAHRRQLLIYAALWQRTCGVWPTQASIEHLDGSRKTIPVVPADVEQIVDELLAKRSEVNQLIEHGASPESLASPSPDACRYCRYRGTCSSFLRAADESWDWRWPTIAGEVTEVSTDSGSTFLRLRVVAGTGPHDGDEVTLTGIHPIAMPSAGTFVAIVNAVPVSASHSLTVDWRTQVWTWRASPLSELEAPLSAEEGR